MKIDPSLAFLIDEKTGLDANGKEPILGGKLREKAVWVDESICIGCRYCAHVATNTFAIEQNMGRSRVFNQDGDTKELVQEAIDTCPVDCIQWVCFEELDELRDRLDELGIQPLGLPPKVLRSIKTRNN